MADEQWLRGVTPGPQVDHVQDARGRRFVHAAVYCREAAEALR